MDIAQRTSLYRGLQTIPLFNPYEMDQMVALWQIPSGQVSEIAGACCRHGNGLFGMFICDMPRTPCGSIDENLADHAAAMKPSSLAPSPDGNGMTSYVSTSKSRSLLSATMASSAFFNNRLAVRIISSRAIPAA